jgi:RNA polymerase sigma factor (sigma-70 family)
MTHTDSFVAVRAPAASAFTAPSSAASTTAAAPAVPGVDVDALYRSLSPRLEQLVRLDVRAPDPVIEDACQFAWSRLVHHSARVRRESALSWLAATAVHEAFKLIRRDDRELSLDAAVEQVGDAVLATGAPSSAELVENRERLAAIRSLPERQQRFLWLHGLGLTYTEMALYTGCTTRTVERQLLRAKRAIRSLAPA